MTLVAVVLVATCALAGLGAVAGEWLDRRRERTESRWEERRHVRVVQVPYDWEERT